MKRKSSVACIALLGFFLAACGGAGTKEQEPTPTAGAVSPGAGNGNSGQNVSPEAGNGNSGQNAGSEAGDGNGGKEKPDSGKPTESGNQDDSEEEKWSPEVEALLAGYEAYEPGVYHFSGSGEEMKRNININNIGYLCEGEDGEIYYTDLAEQMLYRSNADGSERTLIFEGAASNLQFIGGYLYFVEGSSRMLYRCIPGSEAVPVMDQKVGSVIVTEEAAVYCGEDGIYKYDFAGGNTEKLVDTGKYTPIWMTMDAGAIVYQLVDEDNSRFLRNGLVFCYTFDDAATRFVAGKCFRATLEGSRLVYQDYDTGNLMLLDLESGEKLETVFSSNWGMVDGDTLYCAVATALYSCGIASAQKAEEETEEETVEMGTQLWKLPARFDYFYYAAGRIYVYATDGSIYFYELQTGESGIWNNQEG